MGSRMDRYRTDGTENMSTRSNKNTSLYTSLDNNAKYTTITDVRNTNAVELTTATKNYRTREGYHKIKDYGPIVETPKVKKELDDFNYLYRDKENKVYDINSVIEEAKKNRSETPEEGKKAINNKFTLTKEEIEKYREERKNQTVPDRERMKDLINTITSKTLSGELDQATSVNLLSDLMATEPDDKIKENKLADILDEKALEKLQEEKENYVEKTTDNIALKNMDQSFYTRSMDLSDKDFFLDDEQEEPKRIPIIIKIFLVLLLTSLIAVLVYFIIQSF